MQKLIEFGDRPYKQTGNQRYECNRKRHIDFHVHVSSPCFFHICMSKRKRLEGFQSKWEKSFYSIQKCAACIRERGNCLTINKRTRKALSGLTGGPRRRIEFLRRRSVGSKVDDESYSIVSTTHFINQRRQANSPTGLDVKHLMPQQMSSETEKEYAELLAYLDFYSTYVSGVDPLDPIHPVNVMKQMVENFGPAQALEGLRQAVNDTVEDLSGQPPEYVQKLDGALDARGIITFSEVRRRYALAYKRIMERGNIENETEYYQATGILSDHASIADDGEKALLAEIVARYEESM